MGEYNSKKRIVMEGSLHWTTECEGFPLHSPVERDLLQLADGYCPLSNIVIMSLIVDSPFPVSRGRWLMPPSLSQWLWSVWLPDGLSGCDSAFVTVTLQVPRTRLCQVSDSYCIPPDHLWWKVGLCGGADEIGCARYECPGAVQCAISPPVSCWTISVTGSDTVPWEMMSVLPVDLPWELYLHWLYMSCRAANLTSFPFTIPNLVATGSWFNCS